MDINATGQTLKYFRKRANLTQKDVAKSMLKNQQWFSDTENGVSTLLWGDLKKICKLYNTTPSEFEHKENEFIKFPTENPRAFRWVVVHVVEIKKGDDINDYSRMLINTWIVRLRKSYRKYNRYGN